VDRGRWDSEGVSRAAGLRPAARRRRGTVTRTGGSGARVDDRALDRAAVEFSGRADVGSELGEVLTEPPDTGRGELATVLVLEQFDNDFTEPGVDVARRARSSRSR
jgi:hypothetical protein